MKKSIKDIRQGTDNRGRFSAENIWVTGWTYIRHVVDTAREPFLILDANLRIMSANEAFYHTFQTMIKDTEGQLVYKLGGGQWNIPALKRLLEDVLPKNTFFRDFEVEHVYPNIGRKILMMNARQVFEPQKSNKSLKMIILAMEDMTKQRLLEEKLKSYSEELEERVFERTRSLEARVAALESGPKKRPGKK